MMASYKTMQEKKAISRRVLVTGAAGFIGFHLVQRFLENGVDVVGFDDLNDYYNVELKEKRLSILQNYNNFHFMRGDLSDVSDVKRLLSESFDCCVHLAAQAGVRYSIEHPNAYLQSNIVGFFHLLEMLRRHPVKHFLFASSSSVYGNRQDAPFSVSDITDTPVSLYAATKKTDEILSYTYSHIYRLPVTGIRLFTVYGPWGRPDMAYYKFTECICNDVPIQVYNHGNMLRDFTYVDDVVEGITRIVACPPQGTIGGKPPYRICNLGNGHPEKLMDVIALLENLLGKKARKEFLPMQTGDVGKTYANMDETVREFSFHPSTSIETGLEMFVKWYREYYGSKRS